MMSNSNNNSWLGGDGAVAWLLLLLSLVMIGTPHCVLPPPPQLEPNVPTPIFLDLDLIHPLGPGPIILTRVDNSQVLFSVAGALLGAPNPDLNYYWFIDFDVNAGSTSKWDSEEQDFLLQGCHTKLVDLSGADKTATLEVLITEGELDISAVQEDDPRFTLGGEPIDSVRWTLIVKGVPDCDQGSTNDVL